MFHIFEWPTIEQWCAFWKEFLIEFFQYSGLRAIWYKIDPPLESIVNDPNYRKPATFFLWLMGTYAAFFGIASQRYENRIDIIENRANAIFTQLSTPIYKQALSQIPRVQRMSCPVKPEILIPCTVWQSLFSGDTIYIEIVDHLKKTVEVWSESLDSVDLGYAILDSAFLWESNLQGASLSEANLQGANLFMANLQGAFLEKANLQGANLQMANLQRAILYKTDLQGAALQVADLQRATLQEVNLKRAFLDGTDLQGANFYGTKLQGVKNLTIDQLCKASTLYEAELDSTLLEQVRKQCPHLLEKPEWLQEWMIE